MFTALLLFSFGSLVQNSRAALLPPVKLKAGDVVTVFVASDAKSTPYDGDYTVMTDGAIYGVGFGRIVIAGKSWGDAQETLRAKLRGKARHDDVFLAFRKQRPEFAYVIGSNSPGPVMLPSDPITVRQLLPPLSEKSDGQRLAVEIVRNGRTLARTDYARLLQRDNAFGNMVVQPNDLISVLPETTIRVWVLGAVKSPGSFSVPIGADLYQALASAGGLSQLETDSIVNVRHGPDVAQFPARNDPSTPAHKLADGDVVTVVVPQVVRVTVGGEVQKPGEIAVSNTTTVISAIGSASGLLPTGDLSDVLVFRRGEMLQLDLSGYEGTETNLGIKVQSGDTVIVRDKRRVFYVFGEVNAPGKIAMDAHKKYFATDALALSGGLDGRGTLRYVYLMHPTAGKPQVVRFNLDEYLKDGTTTSNPEIEPGDSLLFGQPRGLSLAAATQILSSYVLVSSVTGKKP